MTRQYLKLVVLALVFGAAVFGIKTTLGIDLRELDSLAIDAPMNPTAIAPDGVNQGAGGPQLEGNLNLRSATHSVIVEILDRLEVRTGKKPVDVGYVPYDSSEHRYPWDNMTACWTVREQNVRSHIDRDDESITFLDREKRPTADIEQACYIDTARIYDPWTGEVIDYSRSVDGATFPLDTEHITPWGEAWRSGAWKLDEDQRRDAYNDPLNLVPVNPAVNRGQHSDHPFGQWDLPNESAICFYATRVVQFKHKWGLSVWQAEADAIRQTTSHC